MVNAINAMIALTWHIIFSHLKLKKCTTPQRNYRVVLVVNATNAMIALTWHIIFFSFKTLKMYYPSRQWMRGPRDSRGQRGSTLTFH